MEWKWQPKPEVWDQAVSLARRAASAAPERKAAWLSLAQLLTGQGKHREAADVLVEAAERAHDDAALRVAAARAFYAAGDPVAALGQVEAALAIDPEDEAATLFHFVLLVKMRRLDEAAPLAAQAARINPCNKYLFNFLAARSRSRSEQESFLAHCEATLERRPDCTDATYFKALMLARLGRDEEAGRTLSTDKLVEVRALEPPTGFPSAENFHEALESEIRAHPSLVPDPRGATTRDGLQTGLLKPSDGRALAALILSIQEAVEAYATREEVVGSRFGAARPSIANLNIWAVVYGTSGRQLSHHHSAGWLSGVYYVRAARRPDGSAGGALLLGALDEEDGIEPPWGIRAVEPLPGRLILFPSYMPHATEATGMDGARISVAFDVVRGV